MENNITNQASGTGENSGVILGTSSEAIVEGLHNGQYAEPAGENPDDDDQIVNEQDQQQIVNPQEKEYVEGESEGGVSSVTGIEEDELEEDTADDDERKVKQSV